MKRKITGKNLNLIKLPPMSVITNAKKDPYDEFYLAICDKLGIEVFLNRHQINQGKVSMNTKNEETMARECKKWYGKHGDYKHMGKLYLNRAFPWRWLNAAPRIDDTVKDGYCIVDTNGLIIKRRPR